MSLLSGIKYVSKSDRVKDAEKESDSSTKHKHHKHKHHKHKHHKREHKLKKDKKDRSHSNDDNNDSSDIEKCVDIDADRELMLGYMQSENDERQVSGKRMRSNSGDDSRDNFQRSPPRDYEENDRVSETYQLKMGSESTGQTSSNGGVAALLRARLKSGSGAITSTTALPGSNTTSSRKDDAPDISFMTAGELKWMAEYTRKSKDGLVSKESRKDDDDDNMSLHKMVAAEKFGGGFIGQSTDMDSVIASNIIRKGSNFKGTELGLGASVSRGGSGIGGDQSGRDEGEGLGDGELDMKMLQAKQERLKDEEIAKRIMDRAQAAGKVYSQIIENCARCRGGSRHYKSHRTIASGQHIELRIKPVSQSLDPQWHCELVPLVHCSSILKGIASDSDGMDGDGVATELERFKSCLVGMFEQTGQGVAFLETALHSGGAGSDEGARISKYHTVVDVIPFEAGMEADIEMFFKQALMSAGEEWNTHKKLISINARNPLRKAVPARFAYITAEWTSNSKGSDSGGNLQGFAHLVEDKQKYKNSFCIDVIAGALDVDPFILRKMSRGESESTSLERISEDENRERDAVKAFKSSWSSYDWTQYMSSISQDPGH